MNDAELDSKILAKIKKCLALATSDNPNESATAMRQAHALMNKHGVSAEAVTMADIGEAEIPSRTMSRNKPAQWEAALAAMVGAAFGCKLMITRMVPKDGVVLPKRSQGVFNEGGFIFVGLKAQVVIAAYTAQVLTRNCKKARTNWIRDKLAGLSELPGGRKKSTVLGDEFAMGWVSQIARLVHDFANSDGIDQAIARYLEGKGTKTPDDGEPVRSTKSKLDKATVLARRAGMLAAEGERLHRPVNGARQQALLGF